jgi:hypothetical protein
MTFTRTYTQEELFHKRIGEALDAGRKVKNSSGELEGAIKHLKDAEHLAQRDIELKEG